MSASAAVAAQPRARVLVVDDEPHQREILQMILESEGYEVALAGNGRQARKACEREPFDVVLTDLRMPDLSGIELLSALLEGEPGACVVLMTAHGTIHSAVEAMRNRAVDGPHWYLAGIGVDPPEQRKGIGTALLQPGFAGAAREGLPCVLLTNAERNLSFYRRNGFEVAFEGDSPPGALSGGVAAPRDAESGSRSN